MGGFPIPRDHRDDGCGPFVLAVLAAVLSGAALLILWAVS